MSFGVEASSPFKDQGVCLTPATMAPDDEVHAAAHGLGRSSKMPIVCQNSGRLPTLILCLSFGLNGVADNGG